MNSKIQQGFVVVYAYERDHEQDDFLSVTGYDVLSNRTKDWSREEVRFFTSQEKATRAAEELPGKEMEERTITRAQVREAVMVDRRVFITPPWRC